MAMLVVSHVKASQCREIPSRVIPLQVVEETSGLRRATVVDTATGRPWTPPDSGWLRVKFKASQELPSLKVKSSLDCRRCVFLVQEYVHRYLALSYRVTAVCQRRFETRKKKNNGRGKTESTKLRRTCWCDSVSRFPFLLRRGGTQDTLNPEAAWTAMMLIMGQESDSDRMNVLRLVLRDTYVTTESGQKLIDQLSNMGIYPRDVVEM